MKKILIISNNCDGLYGFRRELIERLSERYFVCILIPDGDKTELLRRICGEVIIRPIDRRGRNIIHDAKLFAGYWRIIRKRKPDIVLTYTIKPSIYGGIICRLTKTAYIANITGLGTAIENRSLLQKILLKMYKLALSDAGCVFFQNSVNQDYFLKQGIINSNHRLIPGSGVNTEEHAYEAYPQSGRYEDKFLFIGRIMVDKGVREFLKAAEQVKKDYPGTAFEMIGYLEENYEAELRDYQERGVIRFWGWQQNVHPFIRECNALVQPSYHEGMSNVLLEAASSGRPVLASDIPGCREAFDEGVSGFGFLPKNADSLYETICKFIELPFAQKEEMGRQARLKMEREFDRGIVVDAYMEEIDKCLSYTKN